MRFKENILFMICIIALLQIFAVIPGIAAENTEQLFNLDEIVVIASKFPEKLLDSIASVEVITKEEIEMAQANNLADILSSVSGLEISDYGNVGGIKAISIRGSSPEQVLVMIDGRPANDPLTGKIDLGQIPAKIIEKIEIYRGPASAVYGANALGGVVNVITKKGKGDSECAINVNTGSFGTQEYEASYQGTSDDLSYFVSGNYFKTDGNRENSQLQQIGFLGKIINQIDQQTDLGFTLRYHDYNRGLPGSIDYPSPQAIQKDRNINLDVTWQKKEEDKDININGFYSFQRVFFDNPGMWGHTGPSIHKGNSMGLSFDMTDYNFTFGDDDSESQHILTYGGEVKNDMCNSTDLGECNGLNGALFVQDVWQPADMEDLKITAGIRYDYNQIFGNQLSPRIAFSYRLQDELNFHASVGKAFRSPTFNDLYWPADAYTAGNPDLIPETAWAYEAGLRYMSEEGDFTGEVNIYRKNVENLINWAAEDNGIWIPSNIGTARIDGIEVLLEKDLGDHLRANLGYTYLNAVDLDTDTQLKPHHKYNFGVGYYGETGDKKDEYYVKLDGYAITERPGDLASYCLIDLNIGKELTIAKKDGQKIKLDLSVKNILDQQPEITSGYPINGRTYTAGVSIEF